MWEQVLWILAVWALLGLIAAIGFGCMAREEQEHDDPSSH